MTSQNPPMGMRDTIIRMEPFSKFQFECQECGKELFEIEDYEEGQHLAMYTLLLIRMENHMRETGHTDIDGDINSIKMINTLDTTIIVNDQNT